MLNDNSIQADPLDDTLQLNEPSGITLDTVEPYEPLPQYTPEGDALVENRLVGLLDDNSKYMQSARHSGMETAANRGLLNSSMAATAGERAAIREGLPIATADAKTFSEAGMLGYEDKLKTSRMSHQTELDKELLGVEAQNKLNLENVVQEGANFRTQLDIASAEKLKGMNISSIERENASQVVADIGTTYTEQIRIINQDPELSSSAKTAILRSLQVQYQQNVQLVYDIYEIDINWETTNIKSEESVPETKNKNLSRTFRDGTWGRGNKNKQTQQDRQDQWMIEGWSP